MNKRTPLKGNFKSYSQDNDLVNQHKRMAQGTMPASPSLPNAQKKGKKK
jgi:hypothetical protein